MHQPAMTSPCMLGEPCATCSAHAPSSSGEVCNCRDCRRGKTLCERATPAVPAFVVTFKEAMTFVNHGLAQFINRNTALRLTFSKIAQLRDRSLKVDEAFLMRYVEGGKSEREAIDGMGDSWMRSAHMGARNTLKDWRLIRKVNVSDLAKIGAEPERIQSFA